MNPKNYKIVMHEGRMLRRVPELPPMPGQRRASVPESCAMCVAMPLGGKFNRALCTSLRDRETQPPCDDSYGGAPGIYLPEEHAQEYVVELVRRRVSG